MSFSPTNRPNKESSCSDSMKGSNRHVRTLSAGPVEIANLLRMDDVMAACSYVASGDVVPPSTHVATYPETIETEASDDASSSPETHASVEGATGSVLMFAEGKDGTGSYEASENFLFTFLPEALVQERLHRKNFVAAGAMLAMRRVEVLRRALATNKVTIEVLS